MGIVWTRSETEAVSGGREEGSAVGKEKGVLLTSADIVDGSENVGDMGKGYESGFGRKKGTTGMMVSLLNISMREFSYNDIFCSGKNHGE